MSRVLVIEDSPAIALLLRRRLEMAGHQVEVAAGGLQALEMLEKPELPQLVLADVMMPGIDGLETLGRIKAKHARLPVILVTGQHLEPAAGRKADAVIAKPIDFDELLRTIEVLAPA